MVLDASLIVLDRASRAALAGIASALTVVILSAPAGADPVRPEDRIQRTEPTPKRLRGVDVKEHLETTLPLGATFRDEDGKSVSLGDYFKDDLPVIVTLNYSNCPMLCSLQLNGLVAALKQLDETPGKEYRVVTVSIDPKETPKTAKETQARYLGALGKPGAATGWHFLTGEQAQIARVANAIGFSYAYNEKRKEYAHPAAFVIATPAAKIARYHYGIEYHPKTLRLSLIETSQGKIGTTLDRLILYCFHYDDTEGRYAPVARNIMSISGGVAVLIFGTVLAGFWVGEWRRKKSLPTSTGTPS